MVWHDGIGEIKYELHTTFLQNLISSFHGMFGQDGKGGERNWGRKMEWSFLFGPSISFLPNREENGFEKEVQNYPHF